MRFTLKFWWGVFAYAVLTGLMVQLVILPFLFPRLDGGAGLLIGHDWNGFHAQAVEQAEKISRYGWQQFKLRPDGENVLTGLLSLLYYWTVPLPWVLLPINAAVFACGALVLFLLIKMLGLSNAHAVFAVSPFVLFPSSAIQFAQIHKDVFCSAGLLVVVWCWAGLVSGDTRTKRVILLTAIGVLATVAVWLFRPYYVQIMLLWTAALMLWCFAQLAIGLACPAASAVAGRPRQRVLIRALPPLLALGLLLATTFFLQSAYLDVKISGSEQGAAGDDMGRDATMGSRRLKLGRTTLVFSAKSASSEFQAYESPDGRVDLGQFAPKEKKQDKPPIAVERGDATPFGNLMNRIFLKLAIARAGFTSSGKTAGSNVDRDVMFYGFGDVVRYVPRALQIGFLAPFPSDLADNRKADRTVLLIAGVEMVVCYLAFLGWLYWVIHLRGARAFLWIPALFGISVILLIGLTVANVGTLYRMRFPFMMIFVSFGLAGLLRFRVAVLRRRDALT